MVLSTTLKRSTTFDTSSDFPPQSREKIKIAHQSARLLLHAELSTTLKKPLAGFARRLRTFSAILKLKKKQPGAIEVGCIIGSSAAVLSALPWLAFEASHKLRNK